MPRRRARRIETPEGQSFEVVDDVEKTKTAADASVGEQTAPPRAPMRPDMRGEDPRAAAARRAAEILGNESGLEDATDDFYIDPSMVPEDWSYEWKRLTVYGAEDPAYQVQLAQKGWQPVPAARHPEMMPSTGEWHTIDRKGMRLMERPKVITDRARMTDKQKAKQQVTIKEAQLNSAPPNTFDRGTHPQSTAKVNKSYEPMVIPQD